MLNQDNTERFVKTVLDAGMLKPQQAEECLQTHRAAEKTGAKQTISDVMVQKGYLTLAQVNEALRAMGSEQGMRLGDFELLGTLGKGGMGIVYKARQISMDRLVALKVLPTDLAADKSYVSRFYREARASAKLDHLNIVRGIAVGEVEGQYYFAMEFVEGESLKQVIENEGSLPVDRAVEIMMAVTKALAHAHERNVIHRDIKPDNILITREGVPKLADLGLAKQLGQSVTELTQSSASMGTPYYMSPEQARDAKNADRRSDVYSLGGTFYHMLTGRVPFEGETPLEVMMKHAKETLVPPNRLRPEIPSRLSLVIEKMLNKSPEFRFQTAQELLQALEKVAPSHAEAKVTAGLKKPPPKQEVTWYFKAKARDGNYKIFKASRLRVKYYLERGTIGPDTMIKRGQAGEFRRVREYPELATRQLSVKRGPTAGAGGPSTRMVKPAAGPGSRKPVSGPGALIAVYEEQETKTRRRKLLRQLRKALVVILELAAFAAVIILGIVYRAKIIGFFRGISEP